MKKVLFAVSMIAAAAVFVSCGKDDEVTSVPDPSNGHEYVDLGLSVKWATCNVGASSPEEYGDYFAWGATEPWYQGYAQATNPEWKAGKSGGYNWANAPYQTANTTSFSSTKFTKYLGSTTSDFKDESATDADARKTVLDLSDDAARTNWGDDWRMPTIAEFQELEDNCTWTWYGTGNTEFGGVAGYKVTGKKSGYEGSFIFLPAAGYRDGTNLNFAGSRGYYWSSSLYESIPNSAWSLYFYSGYRSTNSSGFRYDGQSVRPVCK